MIDIRWYTQLYTITIHYLKIYWIVSKGILFSLTFLSFNFECTIMLNRRKWKIQFLQNLNKFTNSKV